ncbi:MAG: zinc ribbon domain-containing protein [Haloferacaceae archaeon]
MGIIDTVRASLLGDTEERRFNYRCNVCQATFESSEPTAATVGCPHCGAANVREVASGADR